MTEQQNPIQKHAQPSSLARVNVSERGVRISSLDDLWRFSSMVLDSGLAPSGMKNVQAIAIAVEFGMELGLPPMQSVQTICVINNRPLIYGTGFLAVCKSDPNWDEDRFEEWFTGTLKEGNLTAHCRMARKGSTNVTETEYSMQDAITAKLWGEKDNWKKNPSRMLKWRARTWCGRDTFPERLAGLYTTEEAAELIDVEVRDARPQVAMPRRIAAEPVEPPQPQEPVQPPAEQEPAHEPQDAAEPQESSEAPAPADSEHIADLKVRVHAAMKRKGWDKLAPVLKNWNLKAPVRPADLIDFNSEDLTNLLHEVQEAQ